MEKKTNCVYGIDDEKCFNKVLLKLTNIRSFQRLQNQLDVITIVELNIDDF